MASSADSPDPLRLSHMMKDPPQAPVTPQRLSGRSATPQQEHPVSLKKEITFPTLIGSRRSPARTIYMNPADGNASPWRIKVTVEAEPADHQPPQMLPFLSPYRAAPKGEAVRIPLKDADHTPAKSAGKRKRKAADSDGWVPKRKATPGRKPSARSQILDEGQATPAPRKRGRPRKEASNTVIENRGAVRRSSSQDRSISVADESHISRLDSRRLRRSGRSSTVSQKIETVQKRGTPRNTSPEVVIDHTMEPLPEDLQMHPVSEIDLTTTAAMTSLVPPSTSISQAFDGEPLENSNTALNQWPSTTARTAQSLPKASKKLDLPTFTPLHQKYSLPKSLIRTPFAEQVRRHKERFPGVAISGWARPVFSPLPPRDSPGKGGKQITFSSPVTQTSPASENAALLQLPLNDAINHDNNAERVSADTQGEDCNDEVGLWRTMIRASTPMNEATETRSQAIVDGDNEADSEEGNEDEAIPGDYTMMESEEFSMVSLDTLPSAKDLQHSFVTQQGATLRNDEMANSAPLKGFRLHEDVSISALPNSVVKHDDRRHVDGRQRERAQLDSAIIRASNTYPIARLPTPSSEIDTAASSSPVRRELPVASDSETPRRIVAGATLSSPGVVASLLEVTPKLPSGYSPASNIAFHPSPSFDGNMPSNDRIRLGERKKEAYLIDDSRSTHVVHDHKTSKLSTDNGENTNRALPAQAGQRSISSQVEFAAKAIVPCSADTSTLDVWEEEASRDSLPARVRRKINTQTRPAQAVMQDPASVTERDQGLEQVDVESTEQAKPSRNGSDTTHVPLVPNPRGGAITDTPMRQRRTAAEIDAIFRSVQGSGHRTDSARSNELVSPAGRSRWPDSALSSSAITRRSRSTVQDVDGEEETASTGSQLDATTSDVHQIRSEMFLFSKVLPKPASPTTTVRQGHRTDSHDTAEQSLVAEDQGAQAKLTDSEDDAHSSIASLEDNPNPENVEDGEDLDGSLTHVTHASSSLLDLTPRNANVKQNRLFSSPLHARTPLIHPPPQLDICELYSDVPPSFPAVNLCGPPASPKHSGLFSQLRSAFGFSGTAHKHPTHLLLRDLPLLPKTEPWTRTHFLVLRSLYDHCLFHPEAFAPFRPENLKYMSPELAKHFDIEIINWGYGARLSERLVLVARIFCDILVLPTITSFEQRSGVKVDLGACSTRPTGAAIEFWQVLLRVFAIRVGGLTRADEKAGKSIDRRAGQLRWRFKGSKRWIWANGQ